MESNFNQVFVYVNKEISECYAMFIGIRRLSSSMEQIFQVKGLTICLAKAKKCFCFFL